LSVRGAEIQATKKINLTKKGGNPLYFNAGVEATQETLSLKKSNSITSKATLTRKTLSERGFLCGLINLKTGNKQIFRFERVIRGLGDLSCVFQ